MKLPRMMALLAGCFIMNAAVAAEMVPQSREQITLSFAPVVKKVSPAVVNIYTKTRVRVQELSPFMNDPIFRQFFGKGFAFGNRSREQVISSLGSGVIVKPDGIIVTSHHVIRDAQEIIVVLSDKREFEAKLVTRDPQSDLAFLKIEAPGTLPSLSLRDTDTLAVGDMVLAVGNPFGVGQTVTSGIISALARPAKGVSDYQFFIQTDAAINPGNSGGALVDMDGKLIGINTAIYSSSGGSNGIGFAIPANMVQSLLEGSVQGGRVVRPWLGVSVQPVTNEIAESMGLDTPQGVLVKNVTSGSPADKGGLKAGDIVLAVGDNIVSSDQELKYRVALARIGEAAEFKILRKGRPETISIVMQAPTETVKRDQRTLKGKHPLDGVTVANLSPALAMDLGLEEMGEGGVIVVEAGATRFGIGLSLEPGDIILQVNDTKVTTTLQLETLMKASKNSWEIVYQRGINVMTMTVRMQ